MLIRLIAILLLFTFGLSVVGECCLAEAGVHEAEHACHQDEKSHGTDSSYSSHDEAPADPERSCDDHCAACLHTVMAPEKSEPTSIGTAHFDYPPLPIERIHSTPSAIDRPPCWTA